MLFYVRHVFRGNSEYYICNCFHTELFYRFFLNIKGLVPGERNIRKMSKVQTPSNECISFFMSIFFSCTSKLCGVRCQCRGSYVLIKKISFTIKCTIRYLPALNRCLKLMLENRSHLMLFGIAIKHHVP